MARCQNAAGLPLDLQTQKKKKKKHLRQRSCNNTACPIHRKWQILVNVVANHRWRLTRKAFLGGLRPPRPPQLVGRCRGLRRPGPHGHRFGRPLSRPPKASVWGHVQDQPRSTCLVRMIWVKDQHAQHWPWTLSRWKQGGLAPLASICSGSMANAEHAGP